jgi:hypothetical protein
MSKLSHLPEIRQLAYAMESMSHDERCVAIQQAVLNARIDEVKRAQVGKVINARNKSNLTYMSGFGCAANNLQAYKSGRLFELKEERANYE